jgi:Zn-dependent protease with chaperone function
MSSALSTPGYSRLIAPLLIAGALAGASAQTRIALDPNKYSLKEDIELGQEAAAEARRQLPMLNDSRVDDYVEEVGQALAAGIPAEFRHEGFRYTFEVINQKEINAFALPGGPMFLNRGMIEAAETEAQMASVMAHEISHVALRHGTAQATKGQKFQIGAIAGQVIGAIVGGAAGSVIAQGSQFGLSTYFLRYSREYERQADLLGAQIMARTGYDPREMATMFRTIQAQGGRGGPEWLSSHPDPGNRSNAITKESAMLTVQGNADTGGFSSIRSRLAGMPPAYTAEQIARGQARTSGTSGNGGRRVAEVAPPSTQFRTYSPVAFLRVSVPSNWRPVTGGGGVAYAPDGGYFSTTAGEPVFTHGIQIGVAQATTGNLERDTQGLIDSFARSNPQLRATSRAREAVGGRTGLTTRLSNLSEATGQPEYVSLSTTHLRDGNLLYVIGVAPEPERVPYDTAFRRVRQLLEINDR